MTWKGESWTDLFWEEIGRRWCVGFGSSSSLRDVRTAKETYRYDHLLLKVKQQDALTRMSQQGGVAMEAIAECNRERLRLEVPSIIRSETDFSGRETQGRHCVQRLRRKGAITSSA
jgi:hypothetical protein